ncbi:MAG: 30S ribosomal protein S19 [Candidatus Ranarchaeia archaeon]|jgi:small subunit ribosomal protein S19
MPKVVTYRGKTLEEVQKMSMDEFISHLPSRQRRSLTRGFTSQQKKFIENVRQIKRSKKKGKSSSLKTHNRDLIILPEMIGITVEVHNGREFIPVKLTLEHLGHFLGEFATTCGRVGHGNPGIGATRSSQFVPLK